jgi:hypothetical protein
MKSVLGNPICQRSLRESPLTRLSNVRFPKDVYDPVVGRSKIEGLSD